MENHIDRNDEQMKKYYGYIQATDGVRVLTIPVVVKANSKDEAVVKLYDLGKREFSISFSAGKTSAKWMQAVPAWGSIW